MMVILTAYPNFLIGDMYLKILKIYAVYTVRAQQKLQNEHISVVCT